MGLSRCDRCGELNFGPRECGCKPFEIIDNEGDDYTVYAIDEWTAALAWAKESNECNDYWMMDQRVDITVNGVVFNVGAEPDIHYSAHKKEKKDG